MTRSLLIVVGLTLLLIGCVLGMTSGPISQDDAIKRATTTTKGPDGTMMYSANDGDIHAASHEIQKENAERASKRQIGVVLAVPGAILLFLGIAIGVARKTPPPQ